MEIMENDKILPRTGFVETMRGMVGIILKFRYLIGIILIAIGVMANVNGSSIAMWNQCIENSSDSDIIIGTPRAIRGDEWAVLTPLTLSQEYGDSYSWFSELIRAEETDTFIMYSLPVKSFFSVFHPFLIGYIIFGTSRGLAFFWCARFVFLFLVSFDFLRLITGDKRWLSLTGAFMISLAPVVQWWYAINYLVEILIFGQALILLLHKYLSVSCFRRRLCYLTGMVFCAGCYALCMYPAWMIPFAWTYLFLAIWVMLEMRESIVVSKKDVISVCGAVAVLFGLIAVVIYKSFDTIIAVMNTSYPGARSETGGGGIKYLFSCVGDIFLPFRDANLPSNLCEPAMFLDFFPLGLILCIYVLIKRRKKDTLIIMLFLAATLIGRYVLIGVPEIISKITLLSNSTGNRASVILSYINLLMMLTGLSRIDQLPKDEKWGNAKKMLILPVSCVCSFLIVYLSKKLYWGDYFGEKKFVVAFIVLTLIIAGCLIYNKYNYFLLGMLVVLAVIAGAFVNPIQKGLASIDETELATKIKEIAAEDDGKWIVDAGYPVINYPLMFGAAVINSTNTYPDLDRWALIDREGIYYEIYNRYAHITVEIGENEKFELLNLDSFKVYLDYEDLKLLEVSYIMSPDELDESTYEKLFYGNGYYIYAVK